MKQDQHIRKGNLFFLLFLLYLLFVLIYGFIIDIDYYSNDNLSAIIKYILLSISIFTLWFFFYLGYMWAKILMIVGLIGQIFLYVGVSFSYLSDFDTVFIYTLEAAVSFLFLFVIIRSKELTAYMHYKRLPSSDEWLLKIDIARSKKISNIYTGLFCLNIITYCSVFLFLDTLIVALFITPITLLLYYRMYRGYSTARIYFSLTMLLLALFFLAIVFEFYPGGDLETNLIIIFLIANSISFSILGLMPVFSKNLRGHLFMNSINRA